jgi:hypothetical protein
VGITAAAGIASESALNAMRNFRMMIVPVDVGKVRYRRRSNAREPCRLRNGRYG